MTRQQIWLLLDSRGPGGIESHVYHLAGGLRHHRQDVIVVFLTDYGRHPLLPALDAIGVTTRTLDGCFGTLWQALGEQRPAILHTHGYKAGIYGRLSARLHGIPCLSTFHAGEVPRGRLALYDWLDRHSARLASHVLAVSPAIAERLPVPAQIVDNFVITSGLQLSQGRQIAFVGRLSHEKGPDRFIDLAARHPQQHFHVYGDGPMADELKHHATGNVCFHGMQTTMERVWPQIGILVMPSRHEGLPMAAIEAMARGIPVLASDVGALATLIRPPVNGWLVVSGDRSALSQGLQAWLAQDPEMRASMQRAARQRIARGYTADIAIPRLIATYRQTAQARRADRKARCKFGNRSTTSSGR